MLLRLLREGTGGHLRLEHQLRRLALGLLRRLRRRGLPVEARGEVVVVRVSACSCEQGALASEPRRVSKSL